MTRKAKPIDYVLVAFQPSTGALGYWTGTNWDTDPEKALRAHSADTLDVFKRERGKTLPPGWRIGVQPAPDLPPVKKNPAPRGKKFYITAVRKELRQVGPFAESVLYWDQTAWVDDPKEAHLFAASSVEEIARTVKKPRGRAWIIRIEPYTVLRKKNPVPASQYAKMKEAIERYKEFTGMEPEFYDAWQVDHPEVGFVVGALDAVLYTTVRDGVTESYQHKFKKNSRPLLCSTHDGKQLVIVGGRYRFTNRGIVDKG